MRVFHFLSSEFGLKDIRKRRLKIARIMELNDPFEFLGVELSDPALRRGLQEGKSRLSQDNGLLCFTKSWHNPILWSHYADKHRGICLGFDMPDEYLRQVSYVNSRLQWPAVLDESFVKQLLFTKFAHWSYEDEYRSYISLDEPEDGLYYANFSDNLVLRQAIVGPESSISRSQLTEALGDMAPHVDRFKSRAAFKSFRIVENQNGSLWT